MEMIGSLFIALSILGTLVNAEYFQFETCGPEEGGYTELTGLRVDPDPINLKGNMTMTMNWKILRDLPENMIIKIKQYKIKSLLGLSVDIKIPCLAGKFGSCTMPFCKYLEIFKEQGQAMVPEGTEYGCPIKAGDYGGSNMEVQMPDMGAIGRFIVKGRYRTELHFLVDGVETDCYKVWTEMVRS